MEPRSISRSGERFELWCGRRKEERELRFRDFWKFGRAFGFRDWCFFGFVGVLGISIFVFEFF